MPTLSPPPESRIEQAVYACICRRNHSCTPNTHDACSELLGQQTIHAVQTIREGEEITVSYLEPGREWLSRQRHVPSRFGFDCGCALCTLSWPERDGSNVHQRRIAAIDTVVLSGSAEGRRALGGKFIDIVNEKLKLLEEEGMPRVWGHMAMVCVFTCCCAEAPRATWRTRTSGCAARSRQHAAASAVTRRSWMISRRSLAQLVRAIGHRRPNKVFICASLSSCVVCVSPLISARACQNFYKTQKTKIAELRSGLADCRQAMHATADGFLS